MYPLPELRAHWDTFWRAVHAALPASPAALTWGNDVPSLWRSGALSLSQTCGWPLVTQLTDVVRVVGAFDPRVSGARAARYRSVIIARDHSTSLRTVGADTIAAVNGPDSLSGWVSLLHVAGGPARTWKGSVRWSGTHLRSVEMVERGEADIASIDAVSFALFRDVYPSLVAGVVVIGHGPLVPCLPLIVPRSTDDAGVACWRQAFRTACEDSSEPMTSARRALRIRSFVDRDLHDYAALPTLLREGDHAGTKSSISWASSTGVSP
jgi:ABC-type phosphate/phosphonate transport system substrate-binding protein